MSLTWYRSQSSAESCNFGTLAVVWPLLEQMNVARIVNQHLPADPQAEFDHGSVLSLLIAARLYSPVAHPLKCQQWVVGQFESELDWTDHFSRMASSARSNSNPIASGDKVGFRVASIPEPSTLTLAAFALLGLAYARRHRPSEKT